VSFRVSFPPHRHPGESRDPAAAASSRGRPRWTPAFAGATTLVGPEADGNKVLAWVTSLFGAVTSLLLRHPGESRDPATATSSPASVWTPAFAGATTLVGTERGGERPRWEAFVFGAVALLPTLRHPGESRDPAAVAPSRASASWTPAFAGATTVVGPETDGEEVLAWVTSLFGAVTSLLLRHPGESRDPAAVAPSRASASWTPAFAGVTKVVGAESINS
jgi:hypothetical protein